MKSAALNEVRDELSRYLRIAEQENVGQRRYHHLAHRQHQHGQAQRQRHPEARQKILDGSGKRLEEIDVEAV